jgi:hypothetical protein
MRCEPDFFATFVFFVVQIGSLKKARGTTKVTKDTKICKILARQGPVAAWPINRGLLYDGCCARRAIRARDVVESGRAENESGETHDGANWSGVA